MKFCFLRVGRNDQRLLAGEAVPGVVEGPLHLKQAFIRQLALRVQRPDLFQRRIDDEDRLVRLVLVELDLRTRELALQRASVPVGVPRQEGRDFPVVAEQAADEIVGKVQFG